MIWKVGLLHNNSNLHTESQDHSKPLYTVQVEYFWTTAILIRSGVLQLPSVSQIKKVFKRLFKLETNWMVFVSNHVAKVINVILSKKWHYAPSCENLADLVACGFNTEDVLQNNLLINGSDFLLLNNVLPFFWNS